MKFLVTIKNPWLFPAVLLVVVCGLAALKVSGSSVGFYSQALGGPKRADANLLAGHPRGIRSDELAIITQQTIAQSRSGFLRVNPLIGLGQDMSVIGDAPYREWSAVFKPQNWAFFGLPLEQAFAFKWWLLGGGLIASCYFLLETLLPGRRLFNIGLSLSVFFTPFVQWWYQSITIASMAYGFLLCALLMRLTEAKTRRARLLWGAALSYCLVAFVLLLYPPFQIACALAVAAVYGGYLWQRREPARRWLRGLRWPLGAGLVAAAVVGLFLTTRLPTVQAIMGTSYPGHRVVQSGNFDVSHFFSGPFLGPLQVDKRAEAYDMNQSEASNFIMVWPALLIPSVYVMVWRRRKRRPLPAMLLAVDGMLLILAARIFLPMPAIVAKVLLLTSVPHQRLFIGMGLLGIVQMALLVRERQTTPLPRWLVAATSLTALGMFALAGLHLHHLFPGLFAHRYLVVLPCVAVAASVWGLLSRRPALGAAGLLLIGVATSAAVNPLYRGLGAETDSRLSQTLRGLPSAHDGSVWIWLSGGAFTNFLPAQGIPSYSTTYLYPQLNLWRRYDPAGQFVDAYNRYANMGFVMNPDIPQFVSGSADSFVIRYDPCDARFADVRHVLSPAPAESPCLSPALQIHEPNATFYLYDVTPTP